MSGTKHRSKQLEVARQTVVAAFAAHWRKIVRSRRDIGKERADCFFAGSASVRERMSCRFYGREHAQQMARLSDVEIREMLEPWLDHAVRAWLDENEDADPQEDSFLKELPTAEYVSIVCAHYTANPDFGSISVDRYPGERVAYDDLYERLLGGVSLGGVLRIYKSTGESFTSSEARSVRAGIRRDLLSGIEESLDDDPWVFDMNAEGYWETEDFEGEDLTRVVIVEVSNFGE